ncbi:MAG: MFS transporter [Rhodospirillales bacterium]|nr:MFS transporter [Rhodospirillales bacterium]
MTTDQNTQGTISTSLLLRIFIPFALGYFLSYLYRVVNAVIAPDLVSELGLSASDLGLLTSTYFITFAAFQIPLGVLLDRYGPRKTEATLLVFAAAGAAIFAIAETRTGLLVGRALIGFGVSACLMAAFKSFVDWFEPQKLPLVNGIQMASGGLGAISATKPVAIALEYTDWRGVFLVLAALTLAVAVIVFFAVPSKERVKGNVSIGEQLKGTYEILKSPIFWGVAPLTISTNATSISIQSLWAGPWLRDIAGFDRAEASSLLFAVAIALMAGFLLIGGIAERLGRHGIKPATVAFVSLSIFVLLQIPIIMEWTDYILPIMICWGFFSSAGIVTYAALSQQFPSELAGRVNTSINLLVFVAIFGTQWAIGAIIDLWPTAASGAYASEGYQAAFGILWVIEVLTIIWFVISTQRQKKPV